jgi:phage tail-like protein
LPLEVEDALLESRSALAMEVWPRTVELPLAPPHAGQATRVQSLWHPARADADVLVALLSRDERPRRVRLTFETQSARDERLGHNSNGNGTGQGNGDATGPGVAADAIVLRDGDAMRAETERSSTGSTGWKSEWVRWSWEPRALSEEQGGVAAAAQDVVASDNSLVLLLLPGEVRVAEAAFDVSMRAGVCPGDYPLFLSLFVVDDAAVVPEHAPEHAAESEGEVQSEPHREARGVTRSAARKAARLRSGERELETASVSLSLRHPTSRWMKTLPGIYQSEPPQRRGARGSEEDLGEAALRAAYKEAPGQEYQEPPFFGRLLTGFEDAAEPVHTLVGHLDEFFGAMSAPPDFLPWLATWVGLALDENWPQLKKRRLIREAAELYRWRGTRRGLERYLEIYTGVVPRIQDQPFSGMRLGKGALLGRETTVGHIAAHTFRVTLVLEDGAAVDEATVRAIIESHKPAHTAYELRIVPRAQADTTREEDQTACESKAEESKQE